MKKRAVLIVLCAAWAGGWGWCWYRWVSVLPNWVIDLNGRTVVPLRPEATSFAILRPPIQFLNLQTGAIEHEALASDDDILQINTFDGNLAVVRRNWQRCVVDLKTNSVRSVLNFDGGGLTDQYQFALHFQFARHGEVVVARSGDGLKAFDTATGEPIWEKPHLFFLESDLENPQAASWSQLKLSLQDRGTGTWQLIDALTGDELDWYKWVICRGVLPSPCGRFVITFHDQEVRVRDAADGKVLWTLHEHQKNGMTLKHGSPCFSSDGEEVQYHFETPDRRRHDFASWRSRDGKLIRPLPRKPLVDGEDYHSTLLMHPPVLKLVVSKTTGRKLIDRIERAFQMDLLGWARRYVDRDVTEIVLNQSGRSIGLLPFNLSDTAPGPIPDRNGLTIETDEALFHFEQPLRRRWGVLLLGLFAPLVGVLLIRRSWRLFRRGRQRAVTAHPSTTAPPSAVDPPPPPAAAPAPSP